MAGEAASGYETFEHTADVGIEVRGRDLRDLLEQAAAGLIALLVDPATVDPADTRGIEAEAEAQEPEELLVAWLSEILYAFDAEGFAPAAARVESLEEGRVAGGLSGEKLDPERHEVRQPVKAVTYHDLNIREVGDHLEVRIVFDV